MEIILLKDVDTLGHADTIINVKAGYANNYLIPQGLAIVANKPNTNSLNHRLRLQEAKESKMTDEFKAVASKLESQTLTVKAKTGTSGKIFGSITSVQIANAIRDAYNLDIERKKISLPEEVKTVGTYTALIQLSKQVQATLTFEIAGEE